MTTNIPDVAEFAEEAGQLLPRGAAFFPGVTMLPVWQYAFGIARNAKTGSPEFGQPITHEKELIVPVDAGIYSLAGLAQLRGTVADVRAYLGNRALRIGGLVMTRTHRNKATQDIATQLRAAYGPLVFKASIPHSVRVEEAHARGLTVVEFDPKSAPARAYQSLLSEVLEHGQQQQGGALDPDPADAPRGRRAG